MATTKILIAGFGGQGILFAGKALAFTGLKADKEVSWLPSYGPEMRGGTANCSVILSDEPVGSPIVSNPDVLIVMNLPSLDKYEDATVKGGKIFIFPLFDKRFPFFVVAIETRECLFQNENFVGEKFTVIYAAFVISPRNIGIITLFQKSFFFQELEIDKIIIERIRRVGLIRTIPVARREQRQHLPHLHSRALQPIHEIVRALSERADPLRRWQGRNRH